MQKVTTRSFRDGQRLEQALFTPAGQKLLSAGMALTPEHMRVLNNLPDPSLYLADSLDELVDAGIITREAQKAIAAGRTPGPGPAAGASLDGSASDGGLSESSADKAAAAEATGLAASRPPEADPVDAARLRRDMIAQADAVVQQLEADVANADLHVQPASGTIWDKRGGESEDDGEAESAAGKIEPWPTAATLGDRRGELVAQIQDCYARLDAGMKIKCDALDAVVDRLMTKLLTHPQRFTQLALLCPRRQNYLPDHACCVAVLAMAAAARMPWSETDVRRAGRLALLYDIGMMLVPDRIRTGGCELTEIDRGRVQRHTALSVALMANVEGLDPLDKLAAYQHHERENALGYPRGLKSDRLCDYARLLAVCDVFAAATSPRGYHQPKLPYIVMEEVIRSAAAGIFDKRSTRALVQAAGLFPVGSYVLLSNRRMAHVLAAHPARVDRPAVEVLDEQGNVLPHYVELARIPDKQLSIVRAVAAPGAGMTVAA